MSNLPAVILASCAGVSAVANVGFFKRRPVWRGASFVVTGALIAAASAATRTWWMTGLSLVLVAWGVAVLAALASGRHR